MTTFALIIERKNHLTLQQIEEHLKTEFHSFEYMEGFLDGYLFSEYRLLTLREIETLLNSGQLAIFNNSWIEFITVDEVDNTTR